MRKSTDNPERITHPTYKYSYAYNRNGTAYTSIHKIRQTTDLVWHEDNFQDITDILQERVEEHQAFISGKMLYFSELFKDYLKHKSDNRMVRQAAAAIIVNDCKLSDKHGIRRQIDTFRESPDYSGATKNYYITQIKAIFDYAMGEGVCSFNPAAVYKQLTENKRAVPSEERMNALMNDLDSYPKNVQYLYRFIRLTGMRIQEAMSLRVEHIEGDFIRIFGKGSRTRFFPIAPFPELRELIDEIIREQSKKGWLFGRAYSEGSYININRICKRRKTSINFHLVRKYRENELLFKYKFDSGVIEKMFGHTKKIREGNYMAEDFEKKELGIYFDALKRSGRE